MSDIVRPARQNLEDVFLEHMAWITIEDARPFSFKDFMDFEVDGRRYSPSHGVIRNVFSRLKKKEKIKVAYNAGIAFYSLVDLKVTPGGYGGRASEGGRKSAKNHAKSATKLADCDHVVFSEISRHSWTDQALHDIRLLFHVEGFWGILSRAASPELTVDPTNKDIRLLPFHSKDGRLDVRVTVHRSNNISVFVACSTSPIFVDYDGIVRFSNELTRVEERLAGLMTETAKMLGLRSDFELQIPDHALWICKSYHIGRDTLTDYTGQRYCVTWDTMQGSFIRAYVKQFEKDKKKRLRIERLDSPNRSIQEVLNAFIEQAHEES